MSETFVGEVAELKHLCRQQPKPRSSGCCRSEIQQSGSPGSLKLSSGIDRDLLSIAEINRDGQSGILFWWLTTKSIMLESLRPSMHRSIASTSVS